MFAVAENTIGSARTWSIDSTRVLVRVRSTSVTALELRMVQGIVRHSSADGNAYEDGEGRQG